MSDATTTTAKTGQQAWLDGALVDASQAQVSVLTHALHYGTGVFEGVRAYATADGPAIFRLADHTKRLLGSARIIGMDCPFTQEQLQEAQLAVLAANGHANAYIRPLLCYDATSLGLSVTNHGVRAIIATMEWGPYLGAAALEQGISVGISSYRRHHPGVSMCRAKVCGNYINSVLAHQEAYANGFDEALLLDGEGFVSEGSGENLFIVRDGILYTPTLDTALDGITRQTVIELAGDHGIEVRQRRLTRDEVYVADEAFFTGTAAEVTPINAVDRRRIGAGARGPVTTTLQQAYFDCVSGRAGARPHWLDHAARPVAPASASA